jgi:steroid delta-isomerase-like uncharacterized protein
MFRTRTALGLLGLGLLVTPAALAGTDTPHPPTARGGANMTTEPSTEPSPPSNGAQEARYTAIARRWSEELWGRGDLAVADEIIAPDYVRHDAGDPFPARGPEDVKRLVGMLRAMLPDLRIEIEDMVATGDTVVTRYTGVATDTAGYLGRPPTGRTIRTPAIQIFRFAGGQIAESWAVRDDLGTLVQLGHLPPPGPPR